jgi:hypothetical protein
MARSYYFESRRILLQEVESVPAKVPFTMEAPPGDTISRKTPAKFEAKLTRQSRGTRTMLWLWTAEASIEGQGYRVVGAGPSGTLKIPPDLARNFPAVLNLRLYGLNAFGKLYALDKVFQLVE